MGRQAESLDVVLARIGQTAPWVSDDEIARYEQERRWRERADRLRHSGILDVMPDSTARIAVRGELGATDALEWVRRWTAYQRASSRAHGARPVLAIVGAMGQGKTVAAAALIAEEGGRYISAEELCRLYAARWGEDREEYRRLLRSGVLVVDEVGTEESAHLAQAALHDVVDKRQGERLTLLLGNLDRTALRKRLDPRTWDRLRQVGSVVEVTGTSLRQGEL